ncbi:MAG TPA: hypothetical protein VGM06_06520 [Polyangiaceae bacterium]|jgi:hypothetical protein
MDERVSRRVLLLRAGALGGLGAVGLACLANVSCGKEKRPALSCTDTTSLSPEDRQMRTTLAYHDASLDPAKTCGQCQQFIPGVAIGVCATCKVVKGPVNPRGGCKAFAPKAVV